MMLQNIGLVSFGDLAVHNISPQSMAEDIQILLLDIEGSHANNKYLGRKSEDLRALC